METRQPSEVASGMEFPAHPSSGSGPTPSKAKKTLVQPLGSPLPSLAQGQNPQCGFMLRVKRSKHITWGPPPRFPQSPEQGALWGDGPHAALPPCMGRGHPRSRKAIGEDASTCVQADLPARPAQTGRGTEIKSSPPALSFLTLWALSVGCPQPQAHDLYIYVGLRPIPPTAPCIKFSQASVGWNSADHSHCPRAILWGHGGSGQPGKGTRAFRFSSRIGRNSSGWLP